MELEDLRRALLANPDDEAARRRYELALSREGRAEELEASLAFRFRCEKAWEEMTRLPRLDDSQRRCEACAKTVTFAESAAEVAALARAGACIAAPPDVLTAYLRERAPELVGEGAQGPHCLVERELPAPAPAPLAGAPRPLPDRMLRPPLAGAPRAFPDGEGPPPSLTEPRAPEEGEA